MPRMAGRNHGEIVQALIKAKSDLGIVSKSGMTAYGFAASNGDKEAGEMIKKAGGK
jgi:ankyrin repeat protein